jgi:hypothetical protein
MNKKFLLGWSLLTAFMLLTFMGSCDMLDDFEDETYEMESYDAWAAVSYKATMNKGLLGNVKLHMNPDTLAPADLHALISPIADYVFVANDLLTRLDTAMVFDTTFVDDITFTIDTTEVVETVQSYTKELATAFQPLGYFVLEGVNTGEVVFYFNDYVKMKVYDVAESNEPLEILDESIPLELSSGLFTIANRVARPVVRSRYVYELQKDKAYLVCIQKIEQTLGSKYNTVIINK